MTIIDIIIPRAITPTMPTMTPMHSAMNFMEKLRDGGTDVSFVDKVFTPKQIGEFTMGSHITVILDGILWVVRNSRRSAFLTLWGYVAEKNEKGEWVFANVLNYEFLVQIPSHEDLIHLILRRGKN